MECVFLLIHFFINGVDLIIYIVFFAVCMAGAVATLLLPEVKGRDPDLVDSEEIREARARANLNTE